MLAQLGLALYGFYAIRTFEKYTVPATAVVMAVMTVVALSQVGLDWTSGDGDHDRRQGHRRSPSCSPRSGWAGASPGSRTPPTTAASSGPTPPRSRCSGPPRRHVRPDGVAGRAGRLPGQRGQRRRPLGPGDRHLRRAGPAGPAADHARPDRDQHPEPLLVLARRAVHRHPGRPLEGHAARRDRRVGRAGRSSSTPTASPTPSTSGWSPSWCGSARGPRSCWSTSSWSAAVGSTWPASTGRRRTRRTARSTVPAWSASALGILAGWSCQYGLVPAMQGPIARALNNTDLSWLAGGLVAGGLYLVLSRRAARQAGASLPQPPSRPRDRPPRSGLRLHPAAARPGGPRPGPRLARGSARAGPSARLDGVRIAVKDNIDVAGAPTTNGSVVDASRRAGGARRGRRTTCCATTASWWSARPT